MEVEERDDWLLIDLDASCKLGAPAGQKITSCCCFAPELARRELDKASGREDVEHVVASSRFEMRSFGLLLLQLLTEYAPTVWRCGFADNLFEDSDKQLLAYFWDTIKLERIGKSLKNAGQEWLAAADLALWCLQGQETRRPDINEVLQHNFFGKPGSLRFLQSNEESWPGFVQRQAAELHTAIEDRDFNRNFNS